MRHPLHPAIVHFPVACWSLAIELPRVPAGAMRETYMHMAAMLTAFALFTTRLLLRLDHLTPLPPDTVSLVLDAAGFVALAIGGWIGGGLVYVHGVGQRR